MPDQTKSADRVELWIAAVDQTADATHWSGSTEIARGAKLVSQVLASCGMAPVTASTLTVEGLRQFLARWSRREGSLRSILVWTGHGREWDTQHILVTAETEAQPTTDTVIYTADLSRTIIAEARRRSIATRADGALSWAVVVLDCCAADHGLREIVRLLTDPGRPLPVPVAVLATTTGGAGYAGGFASGLRQAVEEVGWEERNSREISVLTVLRKAGDQLETGAVLAADQFDFKEHGPKITNPRYEGGAVGPLVPQRFVGRRSEKRAVRDWLRRAPRGVYVISGEAGVGKTALIAELAASSKGGHVVLSLVQRTLGQALLLLERAYEAYLPGEALDRVERVTQAMAAAARELGRITVYADSLAEAVDPVQLAGTLVARLARTDAVRVIVEVPTGAPVLHNALGTVDRMRILGPVGLEDRTRYVTEVVTEVPEAVARDLAGRQPNFADLRDAVAQRVVDPEVDPSEELRRRFEGFDAATIQLLQALRLSRGSGLPRENDVWRAVADALGNAAVKSDHVDAALDRHGSVAGASVRTTASARLPSGSPTCATRSSCRGSRAPGTGHRRTCRSWRL